MAPYGSRMAPENTMNLKIVEAVYTVVTGEPGHLVQYPSVVMARVSLRPSYLGKVLYPEGKGENIKGTKID